MSAVEMPYHSISQQTQYLEQQQNLIDQTNTQSSSLLSLHDITDTNWPQAITEQVMGVIPQNNPQTDQQLQEALSSLEANQQTPNLSPILPCLVSPADQGLQDDNVQNEDQPSPLPVKIEEGDDCIITGEGKASPFTILKCVYPDLIADDMSNAKQDKIRKLLEMLSSTIHSLELDTDDEVDVNEVRGLHDPPAHNSQSQMMPAGMTPTKASRKKTVVARSPDTSVPGSPTHRLKNPVVQLQKLPKQGYITTTATTEGNSCEKFKSKNRKK